MKDLSLASEGRRKIDWVSRNMPILASVRKDFEAIQPFVGLKIALSIHLEAKTAYLAEILRAGGADIAVTGSNPLSTKDDVVAALAEEGISVYAVHGASPEAYHSFIHDVLDIAPDIIVDDGGDLVHLIHEERHELLPGVSGACEETTAGVLRDKARYKAGKLAFPVVAVNDAYCKHLFDNRYGTGQTSWEAITRVTNLVIAGKVAVVAGYGWCGKGCALRARGLGADVVVCEVDPIKAVEAVMDGYRVMPMAEAAKIGDFFLTATGCKDVITAEHALLMKDGAILANAGHFFDEISVASIEAAAIETKEARDMVKGYRMASGKWVYILGEGRLVNIVCGDGHPAEIMDMSFSLQALSARYIAENRGKIPVSVKKVPDEIDYTVARLMLSSKGLSIDSLTPEQRAYLSSYTL